MIEMISESTFHLATEHTSYVIRISDTGHAEHLYYGRRLRDVESSLPAMREKRYILSRTATYIGGGAMDLDDSLLEFSTEGKGDYKTPLITVSWGENEERTLDLRFTKYRRTAGTIPMNTSLPSAKDKRKDAETLELSFSDEKSGMRLYLIYTVFPSLDAITRRTVVENRGDYLLYLRSVASAQLDFRSSDMVLTTLGGTWAREFKRNDRKITEGTIVSESRRGISSAESNPGFMLKDAFGGCYLLNLEYSGPHRATVSLSPLGLTHVVWGINPDLFSWYLPMGEKFESPEAVMIYSDKGERNCSERMHTFIKNAICRSEWSERLRPLMLSTWEGAYYAATEDKIMEMAKSAKKLGMEGIIVDDGWFGARRNERTSLGDWHVNTMKFPSGLFELAQGIHKLGLLFGLWFEPEGISERSELYKKHPEWIIGRSAEENAESHGEHILDLTRKEVQDWIIDTLSTTIDRCRIDYLRWDMSRSFSDVYSSQYGWNGGEFIHKYVLGLYTIISELGHRFPSLYIETGAAGGGRFDLGMLSYSTTIRLSDDSDPIERAKMMEGVTLLYPLSVIETAITPSPNVMTRRIVDRDTRFNIAAFGILTYSMDASELSKLEMTAFENQIEFYKGYRMLLQFGRFNVQENGNRTLWTVTNKDRSVILMLYLQKQLIPNTTAEKLYVLEADENYDYRIFARSHLLSGPDSLTYPQESECYNVPGDVLKYCGITLVEQVSGNGYREGMRMLGDYSSRLYIIRRIED